ncbi:hypothetical protein KC887_00460 [Candidatus Kaiserbacteria bacterium]|nr:hypothetical protein [Candidatus Kaiserbacteria bacterium]
MENRTIFDKTVIEVIREVAETGKIARLENTALNNTIVCGVCEIVGGPEDGLKVFVLAVPFGEKTIAFSMEESTAKSVAHAILKAVKDNL